jgi:hypothetical protein
VLIESRSGKDWRFYYPAEADFWPDGPILLSGDSDEDNVSEYLFSGVGSWIIL